jgi:hypothetical protein
MEDHYCLSGFAITHARRRQLVHGRALGSHAAKQ